MNQTTRTPSLSLCSHSPTSEANWPIGGSEHPSLRIQDVVQGVGVYGRMRTKVLFKGLLLLWLVFLSSKILSGALSCLASIERPFLPAPEEGFYVTRSNFLVCGAGS